MPGWAVILLMIALVAAGLAAVRLVGQAGEKKECAPARLTAKWLETVPRGRLYQTPATVYHAVFRLEDGRELDLVLEGRDCVALREGGRGMLTWRGKEFLRFREES